MGVSTLILLIIDPAAASSSWAYPAPVSSLDDVAIGAITLGTLFSKLVWLFLGGLMLYFSRPPEEARGIVITVVVLEFSAWMLVDLAGLINGWEAGVVALLVATHPAIGVTGILALRSGRETK